MPFRTAWAAQAQHKTHVLCLFNLGTELSYLLGVLVVTTLSLTLINVAWVKVGTELLVTGYLITWINKQFGPLHKPLPYAKLKTMLRSAWPFAGWPLLRGVSLGTDLIISFIINNKTGRCSAWQGSQHTRKNPCPRRPHLKYSSNSRRT